MVKIYELNGGTNKYLASTATVLEKAGVDVFFGDELAMYGDYLAVTSNVQVWFGLRSFVICLFVYFIISLFLYFVISIYLYFVISLFVILSVRFC